MAVWAFSEDDTNPIGAFSSQTSAAFNFGVESQTISNVITGRQKTAKSRRDGKKYRFQKDLPVVAFWGEDQQSFNSSYQAGQRLFLDPKEIWCCLTKQQETVTSQVLGRHFNFKYSS